MKDLELVLRLKLSYKIYRMYRDVDNNIKHHSEPMIKFIGRNLSIYDKVYDLSELSALKEDLRAHFSSIGLKVDHIKLTKAQTGGPHIGIEAIEEESLEKLIRFYEEDYKTFTQYSPEQIIEEWKEARGQIPSKTEVKGIKILAEKTKNTIFEKVYLFELPKLLNNKGELSGCAGIIVPKPNQPKGRVVIVEQWGSLYPKWIESPLVAKELPHNPHSKYAKFVVNELKVSCEEDIIIAWESDDIRVPIYRIKAEC